jgi:cell wall hydrolase
MITAALCLALNIYFEAAGESVPGKWAVGQVVLNRVVDKRYPNTVCGVVKQHKQFSWYWDGKSDRPKPHDKAWHDSKKVAQILLYKHKSPIYDFSEGATHYFNPHLANPNWRHDGRITTVIGNHVFLRL